ncbi:hypothetical protein TICRE_02180 [Tissierella creatinophila DSM 6911]|uniref:Uncharacterized protein n=1 Tax=Tissierella creatinophila DSM 6911 TaxID=1123403 RepID=A0A1U7M8U4_TISCR|nr:hypothetical protein TICRE_02180 [Tissierella creatinophila DSM 6911]
MNVFIGLVLLILSFISLIFAYKSILLYIKDYKGIYSKVFVLLEWEVTLFLPLGILLLISSILYIQGNDIFNIL